MLIIDVANVMGSRPDGWWRDRPGAATRLLSEIVAANLERRVVAVVEGKARAVADVPGVEVVRATASGDDEIAARAIAHPGSTVVTADRGLRGRLPDGTRVMGPREFLDLIAP